MAFWVIHLSFYTYLHSEPNIIHVQGSIINYSSGLILIFNNLRYVTDGDSAEYLQ
jgi:hypothetical protein